MDIGREIKELRKKEGLSQMELAKRCNLSKNAIWNYENNKRIPSILTIKKIGEVLGVDLGYLLNPPPILKLDKEDVKSIEEYGIGSVIDTIDFDNKALSLPKFVEFLAASSFPFDIDDEEIKLIYDKTINFLEYEFFKLGYIKFSNDEIDK